MECTIWSKASPAWGSARRIQRNNYAFLVTMVMTGGAMECPTCANPLDLDTAEVDRPIPELDYTPGNVVYVCRGCNQGRSVLQSEGRDWTYADMYAAHVREASARVSIPTVARARSWWARRPTLVTVPRYA